MVTMDPQVHRGQQLLSSLLPEMPQNPSNPKTRAVLVSFQLELWRTAKAKSICNISISYSLISSISFSSCPWQQNMFTTLKTIPFRSSSSQKLPEIEEITKNIFQWRVSTRGFCESKIFQNILEYLLEKMKFPTVHSALHTGLLKCNICNYNILEYLQDSFMQTSPWLSHLPSSSQQSIS